MEVKTEEKRRPWLPIPAALLTWAGLWACLCRMAALSTQGLLPLAAGGVAACLTACLRGKRRALVSAVLMALSAAALLLTLDGGRVLMNRLFAASMERQAYEYELFPVKAGEGWLRALRLALIPLGLLTGVLCGFAAGRVLLFGAFGAFAAYLGVTPGLWPLVLLAAGLLLTAVRGRGIAPLAALGVVCALTAALFPGEDLALSQWEERARDALALHTAAVGELPETPPEPDDVPPERQESDFYREEETPVDLGGEELDLRRPLRTGLLILLLALALFVPAVLSDYMKKRRARNRAGLADPDHGAAIRAAFPYAFRWLRLGGLPEENFYSDQGAEIGERFSPELLLSYRAALPVWQEAAYSDHPMTEAQRALVGDFAAAAQRDAWSRMGRWRRLRARYLEAL